MLDSHIEEEPQMIRNVVLGKVRDDVPRELVEEALAAILALEPEGCLAAHAGLDAGLREGAWSFAITSDFVDAEAYLAYDADEEHNRIRHEQIAPLCEQIARVQLEL